MFVQLILSSEEFSTVVFRLYTGCIAVGYDCVGCERAGNTEDVKDRVKT